MRRPDRGLRNCCDTLDPRLSPWAAMYRRYRGSRPGASACGALSPPLVLGDGPESQIAEELGEGGRLVIGVQSARVGEHPGVASAEAVFLQADPRVFDTTHDPIRADTDEGDDRGSPASHFGFESPTAGAQFVVGQFIGPDRRAIDDIRDAVIEIEQEIAFKRRIEPRRKSAAVQGGPEPVAGPAKVPADGRSVKTGIDAREQNNEVFGKQIRNALVARGQKLRLGRFPGRGR